MPPVEGCTAPAGVSPAPSNIPEAIALMNALPKPTSMSCFLESIERPFALYMTSSSQSLQPSPGARSPRTFILRGALEMSLVFEGGASKTLELAFRPTPRRSIKTEILFPLQANVDISHLFDRVLVGSATECGNCHTAEVKEDFDGFPTGAWESDVIDPYAIFNVTLDDLRDENASCDSSTEPDRCEMLSAVLDHGPVQAGELGKPGL